MCLLPESNFWPFGDVTVAQPYHQLYMCMRIINVQWLVFE